MVDVALTPVNVTLTTAPAEITAARSRLEYHRAVLEQAGISSLSDLGTLTLSGPVVARTGIVAAPRRTDVLPVEQPSLLRLPLGAPILDVNVTGGPILRPGFVEASVLPTLEPEGPAPQPRWGLGGAIGPMILAMTTAPAVAVNAAYFVAQTLRLSDDTSVVLQWPHRYLTLIAERIEVGQRVTFTYERPVPTAPTMSWAPGNKPPKPSKAPTPDGLWGVTGATGSPGAAGGDGWTGVGAPTLECWVLELDGAPMFDLRGQDGNSGGRGQDGGDGGDGSDGRAEQYDWWGWCKSGAGWGGDGGPGGDGGQGGRGGEGGEGGRLSLYAPTPVLQAYAAGGFSVNISGGAGGAGGGPGAPGAGGAGGRLGARPKNCWMSEERHDGVAGAQGRQGAVGTAGPGGAAERDAVRFVPIDEDDFRRQLTKPALVSASPARGPVGAVVIVSALRLAFDDVLLIDDVPVPMTVVADTLASFTVPATVGGYRTLRVRQSDGTLSNPLSFYVEPRVTNVGTGGRIRPGSTVMVTGSGFAPGSRVRVLGEDMPDATFVNAATMTFTLRRPAATLENPDGEHADLQVVLGDGTPSNSVGFVIDTLRIVVLGDSVAWGQGLRPHEKFATIVEAALARSGGGIKSYTTTLAHSGATIGAGDTTSLPAIHGEVPTSYPTALQQIDLFPGNPDTVDLILVTAGINDVNIRTVLNPLNTPADFAPLIEQHCHAGLRSLLGAVTNRFPNATVVASAYYPILSDDSDTGLISAFLVAAGLTVGGLPGGALTGGLIPQITTNCRALHELSTVAIGAAVEDVNDTLDTPRVLFADPGYGSQNAALASDPWLFAINGDLSPQDNMMAGERAPQCQINKDRTDVFQCERASIGHPNVAGAQAYADATMAALNRGVVDEEAGLPAFPQGFLWGVATAAMQNEGGITNNDWAAFVDSPAIRRRVRRLTELGGQPIDLEPPGDAVRHAGLSVLEADLDRAAALGINTYRFSVEWARIQPTPPGAIGPVTDTDVDMAAVAYYDQVLDLLQARGMTPVVSLNHLSLPLWVLDPPREATIWSAIGVPTANGNDPDFQASMQGWENPATVDAYVELVRYLVARWSNRVRWWVTLNEPVGSMIGVGYIAGIWPPGFTGDGSRAKTAYFNLIRAHTRSYEVIKAADPTSMVGIAHAMMHAKVTTAVSDHLFGDQEAARNQFDYFYNWHFLDAIVNGRIDTAIHRRPGSRTYIPDGDVAGYLGTAPGTWSSHCDYIGLNYYRSVYVFADVLVSATAGFTGGRFLNNLSLAGTDQTHWLLNDLGWEISPEGFGHMLRELHNRYNLPVLVTENGIPQRQDLLRGAYINAHLAEILAAVRDGVDVRGYLYWTLVDNWEWHEGYRPEARFGLFTVDRSQTGQPRHLTNGSAALVYALSRGDLRGARNHFGSITVTGDRVRPPRLSPALFTGTLAGEPFVLSLRVDPNGRIRGLMHEPQADRVVPVVGHTEPTLGTITLSSPAIGVLEARTLTGQRTVSNGTLALAGTVVRGSVSDPWSATHDPLVGEWRGDPPLTRFRITPADTNLQARSGAWLADALPRAWLPLIVTDTQRRLTLDTGLVRISATRSGPTLTGQATIVGGPFAASPTAWTAQRLPDSLGL